MAKHPVTDFVRHGLEINLSTDNRTVSDTNLSTEFTRVSDEFILSQEDCPQIYRTGVSASFADGATTRQLMDEIADIL